MPSNEDKDCVFSKDSDELPVPSSRYGAATISVKRLKTFSSVPGREEVVFVDDVPTIVKRSA